MRYRKEFLMKQYVMTPLQRWTDIRWRDLVDTQAIQTSQGNIFTIRMLDGRSDEYQNELCNIQSSTRNWWFRRHDTNIEPISFTLDINES